MMNTDSLINADTNRQNVVQYWNNHDFFAPDTVVLGLDIGIEGIGITIRKGQEWIYSKSLLVELPEAEALAARRAFRASRHARKNRKTRMRRLKELFAKHGLPWVNDDIMSRTDPFKLRYRAITGRLASKEALSICIRSCVLRRGYDYFAMNDDEMAQGMQGTQEMPWGASMALTDAKQWIKSAYIDTEMMDYLIRITPLLTFNNKELKQEHAEDWIKTVKERHAVADTEGIPAMLRQYAQNKINEKKARGKNYPRAHVKEHLITIIDRHADLIEDASAFMAALFLPCTTWAEKQCAIFHYNRRTPKEAIRHFHKKVKKCPYCEWLELPSEKCGLSGDSDIRRWKLADFVSTRTFELQVGNFPPFRSKLPEEAIKALMQAIESNCSKWADAKKQMETALKTSGVALPKKNEWNDAQLEQLKDIVTPAANRRHGRASMSVSAARAMVAAATDDGQCYSADFIENWKKEVKLYEKRAEIDAYGGIYPQVQTLMGTLSKQDNKETADKFATLGFLQRLFQSEGIQQKLGGKTSPDYCIIECIKNAAINTKQAKDIQKEQQENRKRRDDLAVKFNRSNCSNADFLRMRLFSEQGGKVDTPARCPFTGTELAPEDLFTAKFQLAHIYPDSRGGLYMADNLVLTTAEINQAMGNRTPREAAQAAIPGWLSWADMLKQSRNFRWGESKRKLFTFEPSADCSFPDFNNTTRTAQLAGELKRMVAIWMGIAGDAEALRTRIGNPCGVYTAAARRSFLWQDYVKDRADNRHHRIDAAVMTCLPPTGLNDVLYKGIFQTEINDKNRTLMCIQGLCTPDFEQLRHDGNECPIVKINSRSKYKSLGDSTFWAVDKDYLTHQRTPLTPDKVKSASELHAILLRMEIPAKDIPSEKKLEAWLISCQQATKEDKNAILKPLKLNNGTPVRNIRKFGSKGNLDNTPIGWNGILSPDGTFDQLRSLTASNDRLELWLGWNAKKKRWEYFKKLIPTAAALAGIKRMGLPWRGTKNAPQYLLDILAKKKAKDLHSLICGTLPPHAVKVGVFRKGDVFKLDFELNPKYIEKLLKDKGSVDMVNHPKSINTWGYISAVTSRAKLEFKALALKDRKAQTKETPSFLATLQTLPENAKVLAKQKNLTPPL